MTSTNRFDWVIKGDTQGQDKLFDRDLLCNENTSFAVVPTKGSLVPGWVLLIPKIEILSLVEIPASQHVCMSQLINNLKDFSANIAENVFMFEHGPSQKSSLTGCGVDQAHLHIVPLNFDLITTVLSDNEIGEWHAVSVENPWSEIRHNSDYYLIFDAHRAYVTYPKQEYSQYFRRKIASVLGAENEWDYRLYPNAKNALRTIEHYDRYAAKSKAA